jgi:RNA-binding protein YlmH
MTNDFFLGHIKDLAQKAKETGCSASKFLSIAETASVTGIIKSIDVKVSKETMQMKTKTVASLRLDVIIATGLSLSRSNASELISANRVSINHLPCTDSGKSLKEGDIVSVHKYGRVKLHEVGGTSKKGRIFITLGI